MLTLGPGHGLLRAVFIALLSYVLTVQLIGAGVAGAASAADALRGLDPHALCLSAASDPSDRGSADQKEQPHLHGLCCTLAFASTSCAASDSFLTVVYDQQAETLSSTADLGARPATAPPKLGRGPRPPPSDLA
jgi:hypothetical protein